MKPALNSSVWFEFAAYVQHLASAPQNAHVAQQALQQVADAAFRISDMLRASEPR